ncbi:hypothetical protein F4809DRAFT_496835 [Biscogniauxia mediterranea]|nr:hypothetical protein F4809DRAFT_496835 [Biscogniauxia mediterranea]
MTAVASPPTFNQHNRSAWGMNGINGGGHPGQIVNPDELNRMFMPRKTLQRNNSSSSISSVSSTSSSSTVSSASSQQSNGTPMSSTGDLTSWTNGAGAGANNAGAASAASAPRKRPQGKAPWPNSKPDNPSDFVRMSASRPQLIGGLNGSASIHSPSPILPSQAQMAAQQSMPRPMTDPIPPGNQPVLYLLSLNGTFERKTISVPFSPDTLRIGRQTNAKTVPTPVNGFFDSKVLSRQHAEIWADRQGKIMIRDVKSSNGTFVNGTRLSQENRESEPHELQTGDHLELGIDIVSEDQKTVVHHKVAAKVEHAGFLNTSTNLLDMNFGDLDPTNSSMMMMGPQGAVPMRQRNGSQPSMRNGQMMQGNGMMAPQANGIQPQRGFFFSPISTEQIVKRLQLEMRNARLQSQDLGRTGHFVQALLSKEDIKDLEKPEVAEPPPKPNIVNGNGIPFRTDNKTRFSDPPAPPPQQPLPEKPDVPSLKRGTTERPKLPTQSASPIRQDGNVSQILQLTEALNSARREIESQTSRMRDLEQMLQREREARELAEELAKRLEDAASSKMNGSSKKPDSEETVLEAAFELAADEVSSPDADTIMSDVGKSSAPNAETIEASATHLHAQIESMVLEMKDLRQQLETYKQRAETAEMERDTDRKSLAEMALQIRRDAEVREAAARERTVIDSRTIHPDNLSETSEEFSTLARTPSTGSSQPHTLPGESNDQPKLSRTNTITQKSAQAEMLSRNQALAESIPYASMLGVVLIGMGLMAYINGWQPQPRLDR